MIVIAILHGTPVWAYVLFAWLVWAGLLRLRERSVPIARIVIVPIIFIAWGLAGLAQRGADGVAPWMLAALAGVAVAAAVRARLQIDVRQRRVSQAASLTPLLRNVSIFLAHYALHVATVFEPARASSLMRVDAAVSGLCAGYFIGSLIRIGRAWQQASLGACEHAPPVEPGCAERTREHGPGAGPVLSEVRRKAAT
ncbi:MAG: DUF6622 family protein [Dokdonella sp.]